MVVALYLLSMAPVSLIAHWILYWCGGDEHQGWVFVKVVYFPIFWASDWFMPAAVVLMFSTFPFEPLYPWSYE